MHGLLQKLLAKRGIKDVVELSKEERISFDNWNSVLSEGELTLEDIKNLCQSHAQIIEDKWKDLNIENNKKAEWIPYYSVYKLLLSAIESPKVAKQNLEKQLQELLK